MTTLTTAFDYSVVEKEAKGKLMALAGQVKRGKANYAKSVLELGCAIHEAHELLAGTGRDGKFKEWCESECGLENRTAYNYLYAFNAFNKLETVSSFSAGAMYALAQPGTPPAARKEAVKRASNGEKISKKVADEIIESHTVDSTDEPEEVSNVGRLSSSQPSVTGSGGAVETLGPSLPPVGTVNRTEAGSQGDGDAGECPRDEHVWIEDVEGDYCQKCKVGRADIELPATIPGGPSFPVEVIEKVQQQDATIREMFKTLLEHVRQSILLVDKIHNATGRKHGVLHEACINHIDVLSLDVNKWQKACK